MKLRFRRLRPWPVAVALTVITVGVTACSSSTSATSNNTAGGAAKAQWKLSSDLPTGVPFNDLALKLVGSGIAQATKNNVTVTEYPDNELYSNQTLAISALQRNQIQAVYTQALQINSLVKAFDGTQVAYIAPDSTDYFKIFAPGTPWFAEASAECAKVGIELVPVASGSPGEAGFAFTSKTPASSLASLSRLKVRVAGAGIVTDELKKLGAQTVDLSTTDTAAGLEDNTVSAALGTAAFTVGPLKGVARGFYDPGTFQYGPYFLFVNLKDWQALGAAEQKAIIAEINPQLNNYVSSSIVKQQQAADQTLVSQGDWVRSATPAQVKQFATELQPFALSIFKKEDPASYQALVQTVDQLHYPLYS